MLGLPSATDCAGVVSSSRTSGWRGSFSTRRCQLCRSLRDGLRWVGRCLRWYEGLRDHLICQNLHEVLVSFCDRVEVDAIGVVLMSRSQIQDVSK